MTIRKSLVNRLTLFVATLAVLLVINFLIPRLLPGNPIYDYINPSFSPEFVARLSAEFGLNQPLYVQFYLYLIGVFKGNFGISFLYYPTPVTTVIAQRLPWTFFLVGSSILISLAFGVLIGLQSANRAGSKVDSAIVSLSVTLRSIPTFWLGLALLSTFAVSLRLFPTSGYFQTAYFTNGANIGTFATDLITHSILPIAALCAYTVGGNILVMRASAMTTLSQDFVLTLNSFGYSNTQILYRHVLRNAFLPMVTDLGIQVGFIISGAVLVETIFSYPGMGLLIYQAVEARDYPMLQGCFFFLTISVLVVVFITDILYDVLDPRIRR